MSEFENWPKAIGTNYLPAKDVKINVAGKLHNIMFKFPEVLIGRIANIIEEDNHLSLLPTIETFHWQKLPDIKQFDNVILYDVIDHLPSKQDIDSLLVKLRTAKQIYVFCHPKNSRLGTHLFDLNLAYIHLFKNIPNQKYTLNLSLEFYRETFGKLYDIQSEAIYTEPAEAMFAGVNVSEVQHVDYLLKPKVKLF